MEGRHYPPRWKRLDRARSNSRRPTGQRLQEWVRNTSSFAFLDELAASIAADKLYYDSIEADVRTKLRNYSTDELVQMLAHYDFRLAEVVKAKMRSPGGWSIRDGKILGAKMFDPDIASLKLILERLRTMDTGGSLLDSLRIMVMVAIMEQLTRNLQGLVG